MIYTVTPNPSLDCYLTVSGVKEGATNRASKESFTYGGKGINVAAVCKRLGLPAVALGFEGGFAGDELERLLDKDGIDHCFIRSGGCTRINIKCSDDGEITEINAPGERVTEAESLALAESLYNAGEGDTVVLSGSQPPCEVGLLFPYLMEKLSGSGAAFVVDTCGQALTDCLKYKPELIKPNYRELCGLFGMTDIEESRIPEYAERLSDMGAKEVLISLGARGAALYSDGKTSYCGVPKTRYRAVNPTGAGDSMIAGYLYAKQNGLSKLEYAVAAGCASAFLEGLCDGGMVSELYDMICDGIR